MSVEDKLSRWEPTYPDTVHPDVVGECRKTWDGGRPWTNIRVLRKGVDASEGQSCVRSGCTRKVEAVQYTSAFGDPEFYCAEHAVEQQERDVYHYDTPPKEQPPLTEAEKENIRRLLEKGKRKKKEEPEEEYEP